MLNKVLLFAPLAPYVIALIVVGAVLVIIALALVICAVIASKTLKMATMPRAYTFEEIRAREINDKNVDFNDYDNNWNKQPMEINGLHGKLRGEIIFNPADIGQCRRVAIICHGHTMNRINSLKYADIFYKLGFNVIIYDHSYFGESEGKFSTLGYYEKYDLSSVIDYAKSVFGADCIIALHGESMGAVTVLSVLGVRSDVDLVVADCPFSNTMEYYRELYTHLTRMPSFPVVDISSSMAKRRYGYKYAKCNPIEDVKQSDTPICFIHGKADDYIYPHHSADMYGVSKNPLSELHLVDGAKHACSFSVNKEAYAKIIGDFVEKVLGKA